MIGLTLLLVALTALQEHLASNPEPSLTVETGLPNPPGSWTLEIHDEACGGDPSFRWHHSSYVGIDGWKLVITGFEFSEDMPFQDYGRNGIKEIDTKKQAGNLIFGNFSAICLYEFADPNQHLEYEIYVYSYNQVGTSTRGLFIHYLDGPPVEA